MERGYLNFRSLLSWTTVLFVFAAPAFSQLQTPNVHAGQRVDAVAIVITRFGPNPASITRPEGPFVLFVLNHSGTLDDTFSLVRKPAAGDAAASAGAADGKLSSLLDLHSTFRKQRDHKLLDPLPGDYELRFLAHPDWLVNITVTSRQGGVQ